MQTSLHGAWLPFLCVLLLAGCSETSKVEDASQPDSSMDLKIADTLARDGPRAEGLRFDVQLPDQGAPDSGAPIPALRQGGFGFMGPSSSGSIRLRVGGFRMGSRVCNNNICITGEF